MSEVRHYFKVFKYDRAGAIHEQDLASFEDPNTAADALAERFELGVALHHSISGLHMYENGEILTYFKLTPLP